MTATCEFCQHPTCWKYDINNHSANENGRGIANGKQGYHFAPKNKTVIEHTGCLPTYKYLNLFDVSYGGGCPPIENDNDNDSDDDIDIAAIEEDINVDYEDHNKSFVEFVNSVEDGAGQQREDSTQQFPIRPNVSLNLSFTKCLKKIRKRQKEVEKQEAIKKDTNGERKSMAHTLVLERQHNEIQKMLVWVPGRKKKSNSPIIKENSKDKVLTAKTIDGDILPNDVFYCQPSKRQERLRSPPGTRSFRSQRGRRYNEDEGVFPPILPTELHLEDYLRLYNLQEVASDQIVDNRGNIYVPSPLRTTRLFMEPQRKEQHACKHETPNRPKRQSRQSVMYIENGTLLDKAPRLVHSQKHRLSKKKNKYLKVKREQERLALDVSRVSISKKALQRYPLPEHYHCKESIRMNSLASDILIRPIAESETSSYCSLTALGSNTEEGEGGEEEENDEEMKAVFEKSDKNILDEESTVLMAPVTSPVSQRSRYSPMSDGAAGKIPKNSLSKSATTIIKERSSVQFKLPLIHSQDSRRISTAPSMLSESTLGKDEADESGAPAKGGPPGNVHASRSRAFSVLSEQSSEFSYMNKELMDQTYDKYHSFTPFKTPLHSKHMFTDVRLYSQESKRFHQAYQSNRPILPQSMHNLSDFLPVVEEDCLQKMGSFQQRNLSPSRSMFIRQPKQPAANLVPAEMKISQVQLFPPREKSPYVMKKMPVADQGQLLPSPCPHIDVKDYGEVHLLVNKHLQQCHHTENTQVPPPSPAFSKATDSESQISVCNTEGTTSCSSVDSISQLQQQMIESNINSTEDLAHETLSEGVYSYNDHARVAPDNDVHSYNDPIRSIEASASEEEKESFTEAEPISQEVSVTTEPVEIEKIFDVNAEPTAETKPISEDVLVEMEPFGMQISANELLLNEDSPLAVLSPSNNEEMKDDCLIPDKKASKDSLRSLTSPIIAEDFTVGLEMNLDLSDDVLKAMNNFDDFILDIDDLDDDDDNDDDDD